MVVVAGIALKEGNPRRLIYGTDYRGKVCGYDDGLKDRKLIVYPRTQEDFLINFAETNPLKYKFYGVCVEKCPVAEEVNDGFRIPAIVCNDELVGTGSLTYEQELMSKPAEYRTCMDTGTQGSVNCKDVRRNCWFIPQDTKSGTLH